MTRRLPLAFKIAVTVIAFAAISYMTRYRLNESPAHPASSPPALRAP